MGGGRARAGVKTRTRPRRHWAVAASSQAKVAHNFPRSLLRTVYKRCNCNDAISRFELVPGELRATLLSCGQDGATHSRPGAAGAEGTGGAGGPGCDARGRWQGLASAHRTTSAADVKGAGGSGGPGCGAGGRWQGLAGLRGDAPSEARSADGSRAGRRPRAHQAARPHNRVLHRRNISGATHHRGIAKPPGPAGAGRLTQYQRIIEEPRQYRDYRGRFPGARSRCRASRRCPWRCLPSGDPRRRR